MVSRYQPLADYLTALSPETTQVALSFSEIEGLLGEPLPRQAATAMWWSNTPRFRHAVAWMRAGWYVTARSMRTLPVTITFERAPAPPHLPFASPSGVAPAPPDTIP